MSEQIHLLIDEADILSKKKDKGCVLKWEAALNLAEHNQIDTLSVQILEKLTKHYYIKQDYEKVFDITKEHLKDPKAYADLIHKYIDVQMTKRSALMFNMQFDKALATAIHIKDVCIEYKEEEIFFETMIAEVYMRSNQPEKAIEHAILGYKKGKSVLSDTGINFNLSYALSILYTSYFASGQYEKSAKFYQEFLELMDIDSKSVEFRAYHFLNSFSSIRNEDDFENLIELYHNTKDAQYLTQRTKCNMALDIAEKYKQKGKYNSAIKYWKLAFDPNEETLDDLYPSKNIYESYIKLGQADSALHYNKIYNQIVNQSNEVQTKENMNELTVKYETVQKDAELTKKKTQIIKLIGGIVAFILLSLLLFFKYINQKKLAAQEIAILKKDQKLLAIDYMVQGQEEERKRIAQDLHDGIGGILTTAKIHIQNIQKEIDQISQMNLVSKAEEMVQNAYSEVRRISHDMMPGALVDLGLLAAVEDLVDEIMQQGQTKINLGWYVKDSEIKEKQKVIFYRIIQEALNNSEKHANAKNINIELTRNKNHYHLTIEDDGVGYNTNITYANAGIGMKSMRSRVEYLNGELNVTSAVGQGVLIDIIIPC